MKGDTYEVSHSFRKSGAVIFDYIGINRWNNDYKKSAVYAVAKAMAGGKRAIVFRGGDITWLLRIIIIKALT
jgi:hypothetical protein